jgi:uncharacterized SAM-binding protein YcdF (DUF218 family)
MELLARLADPPALFAGGLFLLVALAWRSRHRLTFALSGAVLLAYLAVATPIGANLWTGLLEDRVATHRGCEPLAPNAVAGDAVDPDVTRLSASSLRRAMAAARIGRRHPAADFVVSGGSPAGKPLREADLMGALMTEFGVGAERVQLERDSRNTWENATKSLQRIADRGWRARPVYLLTSAMHLPRATATFRKAGIEACPIATDRRGETLEWESAAIPNAQALLNSLTALHEVVGLLAYGAAGRL